LCAARRTSGATGCLGGMGTSGLVSTFGPISEGRQMLVGGFMRELRRAIGPAQYKGMLDTDGGTYDR
jgi:hypothetical protein